MPWSRLTRTPGQCRTGPSIFFQGRCVVSRRDPDKQRAFARKWMAARRARWMATQDPCVKCGSRKNLEIDHIDPRKKRSRIIWSFRESKLKKELRKCQILCRKCHIKKTTADYRRFITHCVHGHAYDEQNTKWISGRRHCKMCNRLWMRGYNRMRRAKLSS